MTRETARQWIPILEAYADGKTIEHRTLHNDWYECEYLSFDSPLGPSSYRIKLESRLRPWRIEEVPVGAMVRMKGNKDYRSIIICAEPQASFPLRVGHSSNKGGYTLKDAMEQLEYSLDMGKYTWHPCGVME